MRESGKVAIRGYLRGNSKTRSKTRSPGNEIENTREYEMY
jgi:hypothetical protein